ncbi:hypothetical protein [Streptosporangium sp. NPDC006007]|uniref:hypothetical protein n=1 Tax=Streptosporangium sp. NPDC006007 TaxID=3154575 RepID=UPI0033AA2AC6
MRPNPFNHAARPLERSRDSPLRPWDITAHEECYVAVDDTEDKYMEFCTLFEDLSALQDAGHVILATGGTADGKTSLLNRCAAALQGHGLPVGKEGTDPKSKDDSPVHSTVKIVDLSGLRFPRENDSTLYQEVLNTLVSRGMKFSSSTEDTATGYAALSSDLGDMGNYLVVLLPPADTVERVRNYLRFARNRIVFMTESSRGLLDTISRHTRGRPEHFADFLDEQVGRYPDRYLFHMHVGPLKPDDYWKYVKERVEKTPESPRINEELIKVVRDRRSDVTSIGQWRKILFEVFSRNRMDTVDETHFEPYLLFGAPLWKQFMEPEDGAV